MASPDRKLEIVQRRVADLVPYANNARTHSDAQVAQIVASIQQFGFTNPILIDEQDGVIAGHARLLAARKIGLDDVPTITLTGLTSAQKRAYVIADNKIALGSGWDVDLLRVEFEALKGMNFDLKFTGFGAVEIRGINLRGGHGNTDPDDVPEPPAVATSQAADIWVLGSHRLICGDSTNASIVWDLLAGDVPHLMVTDPPYGVDYDPAWRHRAGVNQSHRVGEVMNDNRADWRDAWALFPGDVAYVWHGGLHAGVVQESLGASGFTTRAQIIWAKDSLVMGRGHYHWQHEPCWYAVRDGRTGHWGGDRKQSTVWSIPTRDAEKSRDVDAKTVHSTQKPVECMRRPIENNSVVDDLVYEPFSGSGTTIIAAEMSGRRCRAIELNPVYVDVAVRRWEAFTGRVATLAATGESFSDVFSARRAEVAA